MSFHRNPRPLGLGRFSAYLDPERAWESLLRTMESLGFRFDEERETWVDAGGQEVEAPMEWCSMHEASVGDFPQDTDALRSLLHAVYWSNLPEDSKSALQGLLGSLLDACQTEEAAGVITDLRPPEETRRCA